MQAAGLSVAVKVTLQSRRRIERRLQVTLESGQLVTW
jgi:hypothetical protein